MSSRLLAFLVPFFIASTAFAQAAVDVEVTVEAEAQSPFIADDQPPPAPPAPTAAPVPVQPAPYQPAPVYQQPGYQPGYAQPGYPPQRRMRLPYTEGQAIPPGGQLVERFRLGLIISGAAMFAVPYIVTVSLIPDGAQPILAVPAIGPFLAISDANSLARPFLVIDGIVQTAGLALLIVGLTVKQRYIQMYASDDGQRHLALTPFVGPANGLSLDLTF